MAYKFKELTQNEIDEFLGTPHHAVVATNRIDGPPQISPVWYLYEEGRIYIVILVKSAKYRNLRRDPRISICIDAGHPDARAITVYGSVELIENDKPRGDNMFWRITRRYVETDEIAHEIIEDAQAGSEKVLAIVTPSKTIARDYN